MALNKSDKNYIILILVVLISVLSMKVRPINFRLVLKAITLLFLIAFLYKKDFKVSLFLTLLLFSLNQNGIRNSVDYFQNGEADAVSISPNKVDKCSLKCYQDDSISLDDCDTMCQDPCKAMCAEKLSASAKFTQCNNMCDSREQFQNNDNSGPLESDERKCRIKCLEGGGKLLDCKPMCEDKCVNTCTSSNQTFSDCQTLCRS